MRPQPLLTSFACPRRALPTMLVALLVATWGGLAQAAAPFVDNGDSTVTDTSTGLMWDQCTLGLSGADCASGTAETYTWENAIAATAAQSVANYKGYRDWRLPSIVELQTLLKTGSTPAIDTTAFPNTPLPYYFWSSSIYAPDSALAWYINFGSGEFDAGSKVTHPYRIRLVRSGQYFGSFALVPGGISATTTTTVALTATSPVAATGYWLVVPRDATPPTPAQVIAGVDYSGIAVKAGNDSMSAKAQKSFGITGLAAGTAYDLYLVATATPAEITAQLVGPMQFSTIAIATRSIVIDPATPAILYAGLDGAGIYKSTDSGANWTAATVPADKKNVRALAIKPGDSSKLFAAIYGGGMLKSEDSGATWTACAGQPGNLNLVSLASDASGKLYVGSEAGVFKSDDACANWTAMNTGLPN